MPHYSVFPSFSASPSFSPDSSSSSSAAAASAAGCAAKTQKQGVKTSPGPGGGGGGQSSHLLGLRFPVLRRNLVVRLGLVLLLLLGLGLRDLFYLLGLGGCLSATTKKVRTHLRVTRGNRDTEWKQPAAALAARQQPPSPTPHVTLAGPEERRRRLV